MSSPAVRAELVPPLAARHVQPLAALTVPGADGAASRPAIVAVHVEIRPSAAPVAPAESTERVGRSTFERPLLHDRATDRQRPACAILERKQATRAYGAWNAGVPAPAPRLNIVA